jgi:hypothetical protein
MKLNLDINKKRQSVMVSYNQLQEDLLPIISDCAKDDVDDLIKDRGTDGRAKIQTSQHLDHMLDFMNWQEKEVIELWCEVCAETFFREHSSYDDVFLLKSTDNSGMIVDATWLASKECL